MFSCVIRLLSLSIHLYQIKTPFRRNSVLLTRHHATPIVTLFFVEAMFLCDITLHSCHQVQHQCYLREIMPRQWSLGDLPRMLRISENVFYSQAFFYLALLHSFLLFKASLGPAVQPQSQKGFMLIFETQPRPDYLFES